MPTNNLVETDDIKTLIKNNTLKVKVAPNAAKTELKKIQDETLYIAIAAPPEKGKANKELLRFLKKEYNIKALIKSGEGSREKIIQIYESL